ncbi:hypothetical protein BDP27DRAFT_1438713 [Rhodocollybia butyracea]|uniref:Transmembrane protein n=1 Tax=Rhodocollybia butyracea TaxID=206335 RepID=A0A9P5P4G6_9AGAR|nr:hypothetical protein BDP27DRAFT_1438713 [Rhodocollybia butyracea]
MDLRPRLSLVGVPLLPRFFAVNTTITPITSAPSAKPTVTPSTSAPSTLPHASATLLTPAPTHLPLKTNVPQAASSPTGKRFIGFVIGVIIGGLFLILLLTWWLVRRRRKRQLHRTKSAHEVISPFDPPASHATGQLSMVQRLSRPIQVVRSKQSEMHERERRARMDAHKALHATHEVLNRASSSHEEEASLRQQISELIQIVRRIEERGVANESPPDYESQP